MNGMFPGGFAGRKKNFFDIFIISFTLALISTDAT